MSLSDCLSNTTTLLCMMMMMTMRSVANISMRSWTHPMLQSPIVKGRVLHLVDLILLWELEPSHYQPPQTSMGQTVVNLVDC